MEQYLVPKRADAVFHEPTSEVALERARRKTFHGLFVEAMGYNPLINQRADQPSRKTSG